MFCAFIYSVCVINHNFDFSYCKAYCFVRKYTTVATLTNQLMRHCCFPTFLPLCCFKAESVNIFTEC